MIYDISPLVDETTPIWPGDVPLSRTHQCRLSQGDSIDLSSLSSTVHIGAHADAPSHFSLGGSSIDELDLTDYLGSCHVVSIKKDGEILPEDLLDCLKLQPKRVLIRTDSFDHNGPFKTKFAYFHHESIRLCGENGVRLIGIDTPSFDSFDSKNLDAHRTLLRFNIRNLECLDLSKVSDGEYELVALPLKLKGFDASPVRAILKTIESIP